MTSINSNIEITAKRVVLRPVSMEYKAEICREFTAEVTRYMPFTPNGEITMTEEFIRNSMEELERKASVQLCILLRNNGNEFLGCCGMHNINTKAIEIGLWIKKSAHGKGYGKETVRALTDWAKTHLDFEHLLYPVDKENVASRRIPEGLGFTITGNYVKRKSDTEQLNIIEYRKNRDDDINTAETL